MIYLEMDIEKCNFEDVTTKKVIFWMKIGDPIESLKIIELSIEEYIEI
jgi:hypothetical protein